MGIVVKMLLCTTFVSVLWFPRNPVLAVVMTATFHEEALCNAAQRVNSSCYEYVQTTEKLDCFSSCNRQDDCLGLLIALQKNECYHSLPCNSQPACTFYDPSYTFYRRLFANSSFSGSLENLDNSTSLFTESPETTSLVSAEEIEVTTQSHSNTVMPAEATVAPIEFGHCKEYSSTGVHQTVLDLFKDGSFLFTTKCRKDNFALGMITMYHFDLMRSSGTFDLSTLTWNDYVNGYNLGPDDYWIGLENFHKFTGYGEHRVFLFVEYDPTYCSGFSGYGKKNFKVHSAASGYSFSYGPSDVYRAETTDNTQCWMNLYNIGFNDSLFNDLVGVGFSSWDNDQDEDLGRNCAQLAGAGWWFKQCDPMETNPLGRSYQSLAGVTDKHVMLKGLDASSSNLRNAIKYIYMTLEESPGTFWF